MIALSSYVGFFTLLWFTWLQVTLFDTRFNMDSIFDRICKALRFGVMIGFAVVGPSYQDAYKIFAMQQFTLILMASRWIPVIQCATVLWFARRCTNATFPLMLKMATLVTSALTFLGIYFSFNYQNGYDGQIGLYIVSIFEAVSIMAVSSYWRDFSFKYTCLSQRVGHHWRGYPRIFENAFQIENSLSSVAMVSGMAISAVLITVYCYT